MPATWIAGATGPPARFIVTEVVDDVEVPYDLTDFTVAFRFARKGQQALWDRDCTLDTPAEGTCHCDWVAGDLDESGEYEGQLFLTDDEDVTQATEVFDIVVERGIEAPPEPGP